KTFPNFSAFSSLRLHTFRPLPSAFPPPSHSSQHLPFAFSFSLCLYFFHINFSFASPFLLHVAFCIFSTLTLFQPQCPSAPAATGLHRKLLELGWNDKLRGGDCRAGNHRFDLIELKRRRRHLKGLSN
ncbi:hypothetical protein V8G54_003693, partial [Vigna mungo]